MQIEETQILFLTGASVFAFALIHLFIGKLTFLDVLPRSRWLSFAGGVAVAYVFLHILPELSGHQKAFAEGLGVGERAAESWVYLISFSGLALFYGLERAVKKSRKSSDRDRVEAEILWLHIISFGIYNILIGYLLLHREETGVRSLVMYTIAMSLHFVTNDYGLRQDQKNQYDAIGRWAIAGSVLFGWALAVFASLPRIIIGFLFAFLAGGVILNVLKEELPGEYQSRFWPFVLGGASYASLLILV